MVTYDDDTTIQNPAVRSTGILRVNTHRQDDYAIILFITQYSLLIIYCGVTAGRVMLVTGLKTITNG